MRDLGLLPWGKRCMSPQPIIKRLRRHPSHSWSLEAMPMVVGQGSSQLPCISLMETGLPAGRRLVCLEVASFRNTKGPTRVAVVVALMLELPVSGAQMCSRPETTNRTATTQVLQDRMSREVARG